MAPSKPAAASAPFNKEEKVLCFHHEMLYEAKILDVRQTEDHQSWQYKIHYKGWKNTVYMLHGVCQANANIVSVSETRGIFCAPSHDFQSWKERASRILGLAAPGLPGDLLSHCTALHCASANTCIRLYLIFCPAFENMPPLIKKEEIEDSPDNGVTNSWDDWVPQDRVRKFTDENKELAANLHNQMKELQRETRAPKSSLKKGGRANGSDFSSARGSEERHTSMAAQSGRGGPRRNRDYDLEPVSISYISYCQWLSIILSILEVYWSGLVSSGSARKTLSATYTVSSV
jgi:hypothetical protein